MKPAKLAILISGAIMGILATAGAAFAVPAVATGAVNVRTGPSVNYTRVDTLYRGEQVNVTECRNGWCYVQHTGPDGWVSGNYLANINPAPTPPPPPPPPPVAPSQPSIGFGITFGSGSPSISFSIGNHPSTIQPVVPQVCFYDGANYTGASVCVNAGTNNSNITGNWNNRISSIRVQPGVTVKVCRDWGYNGFCQAYNSNVSQLPFFLNNRVSSYKTYY